MITQRRKLPLRLGICLVSLAAAVGHGVSAQVTATAPDDSWEALDPNKISVGVGQLSSLVSLPRAFQPFRLKGSKVTDLLESARQSARPALSSNNGCNGVIMTLPKPTSENIWLRFCVTESSIMEPELAAEFPRIKTYAGQGLDDPTMTVRLDWTPQGLHAMVLGGDESFYIDPLPLQRGDLSTYMGYFDHDAQPKIFQCYVKTDTAARGRPPADGARLPLIRNGEDLRTYRLAVAATGEYTQFQGGTVEAAFAGIVITINRVNAIYNHELAIQLILVKNQKRIIYTDPNTDPYTNDNAGRLLSENQQNLDKEIGSQNYDIGHVFGTGGGGLASLGVVGRDGSKAQGETGSSSPKGDPFDVDYVAHEMGHQFGANHTFNGTTSNCNPPNRNGDTAFEPGSGSTIMAYAGICGDENLQDNSDPFFHFISLFEILSYVSSDEVKAVPRITKTLNAIPTVSGGSSFRIPRQTPFSLTASGSDADGDSLSFSWEELDLGKEGPPNDDDSDVRPIFRSFRPATAPSRSFPTLSILMDGTTALGEALPTKNRTMRFVVTARDNRVTAGAFGSGTTEVAVVTDSGPFVVTQPGKTSTWTTGSTQTVTWNPAGTGAAPINCRNVRISFSKDGGKTFTVLKDSTPNTGSATIMVPNSPTLAGKVKVEAVGNIFFNLSQGNFKVVAPN